MFMVHGFRIWGHSWGFKFTYLYFFLADILQLRFADFPDH